MTNVWWRCKFYIVQVPEIFHGEPLVDRKSIFQAHLAVVHSPAEAELVLRALKRDRKIARATHNIVAYRIVHPATGGLSQDNDDDGETAAGGRLAHLLSVMEVENLVVIVSRWYGGVHLGSDRFKHINNVARLLIEESGLTKRGEKKDKTKTGHKKAR